MKPNWLSRVHIYWWRPEAVLMYRNLATLEQALHAV